MKLKKEKQYEKIHKKLFTGLISMLIISCIVITAFAAVLPDINSKTTRIGSLNSVPGYEHTQGLSVTSSGSNNRLFVLQKNDYDTKAVLYMYKDYTTMSNSSSDEYGTFVLSNFVGHANAMAIDGSYIYIACWNRETGANGKKIARISRSKLWSMYKSTTATEKGTLTASSDGVTIMPVVNSNGTAYAHNVTSITYYKDGKFIVNRGAYEKDDAEYFQFTTAEIVDGKFVVSNSASDKFEIAYEVKGTTPQDIGYDEHCGFFIVRYLGGSANEIIWIKLNSLTGDNRIYRKDNSKYRIINVNKRVDIFKTYELESVSIGKDNHMYASVNTKVHPELEKDYPGYDKDAIIRIERPTAVNGQTKFFGATITE